MLRVAINGFGRIGRATFKIALQRKKFKVVAINDLTDPKTLAYLLKHDTVYGLYDKKVRATKDSIIVDGEKYPVYSIPNPEELPWKELKVDMAIECTGVFRKIEDVKKHLKAGAKRAVLSAPGKSEGIKTFVMGVNDKKIGKQKVVSNASCTTNCVAPVMAIMQAKFGVKKALMTTVHSYTAGQKLVDAPSKDLRRGRAAAENIVPTTTGAATATAETIPVLKGKFDGISIRVPTPCGSLSDFTILTKKKTTVEKVNKAFKDAMKNPLWKGILTATEEPIVSSDIIGTTHASIVDLNFTKVVDGDLVKILSWYDNEWAYSYKLVEMVEKVGKSL